MQYLTRAYVKIKSLLTLENLKAYLKSRSPRIIAILVMIMIFIFRPEVTPEIKSVEEHPLFIDIIEVKQKDIIVKVPGFGTVEPRTKTLIINEVAGRILEISPAFENGGFVRENEILLRLDDSAYRTALKRAESQLASAKKILIIEKSQSNIAKGQWNSEIAKQSANKQSKELFLRKPFMEEAIANLSFAEAQLEKAKKDILRSIIRAPYDGLVQMKFVDESMFLPIGAKIAQIFAIDYAEVSIAIPQSRLSLLKLPPTLTHKGNRFSSEYQSKVVLSSDFGGKKYEWEAQLIRSNGVLDSLSRSLTLIVQIKDPYGLSQESKSDSIPLLMGTFVDAQIDGITLKNVAEIPRYAVQPGDRLWLVDDNDRLKSIKTTLLRLNGDNIYILDGLNDRDKVVLTVNEQVLPGVKVSIRNTETQWKQAKEKQTQVVSSSEH